MWEFMLKIWEQEVWNIMPSQAKFTGRSALTKSFLAWCRGSQANPSRVRNVGLDLWYTTCTSTSHLCSGKMPGRQLPSLRHLHPWKAVPLLSFYRRAVTVGGVIMRKRRPISPGMMGSQSIRGQLAAFDSQRQGVWPYLSQRVQGHISNQNALARKHLGSS